jgi:hypothetical protein
VCEHHDCNRRVTLAVDMPTSVRQVASLDWGENPIDGALTTSVAAVMHAVAEPHHRHGEVTVVGVTPTGGYSNGTG